MSEMDSSRRVDRRSTLCFSPARKIRYTRAPGVHKGKCDILEQSELFWSESTKNCIQITEI